MCSIKKGEKEYIASCSILSIYSQGSTPEEAQEAFKEAVISVIECCIDEGTLDNLLHSCCHHNTIAEGEQDSGDDLINVFKSVLPLENFIEIDTSDDSTSYEPSEE